MRIEGSRIVNELLDFLVSGVVVFGTVFVVIVVLEVALTGSNIIWFLVVVVVFFVVDFGVLGVVTVDVVASVVVSTVILRDVITKVSIEFVIPPIESDVKLTALVFAASRISFSSKLFDSASNIAMAFWVCLFRLSDPNRDCDCDSVSFAISKPVTLRS